MSHLVPLLEFNQTPSESARTIALERFRILQPHLEQERFLTKVARDAGIPYRRAQRWVTGDRKYGLIGLTRGERDDWCVRDNRRGPHSEVAAAIVLANNRARALRHSVPSRPVSMHRVA
jgi:leucine-zipper of insertion element IS481